MKLAQINNLGSLKKPSKCLQTVCVEAEKIFKQYPTDFLNSKKMSTFSC